MAKPFLKTMLAAVLILPGTALVYVPALLVWLSRGTQFAARFPPESALTWLAALVFAVPGILLMGWTMRLFVARGGGGTPAPWAPINRLIVEGPYRHSRNPMLAGVCLTLVAEAILLGSWPIFAWAVLFFALNTVYFARVEEPALARRYGADYDAYRNAVPRWGPRLTPYAPHR